jgi:hypothetical protein
MIKIVCSNCGKGMGEKDGQGQTGISHSICNDCIRTLYGDEFTEEEMQRIMKGANK